MRGPRCTIIAGPNGSGKSSLYNHFDVAGEFVNADVIAASLPADLGHGARQVKAGKIVIARVAELIARQADFVFETTLSSRHSLNVMRRARDTGFEVDLIYIALDTPQRNIDRVHYRVALGGHDIPAETIMRRYTASLRNLPEALELSRDAVIIDNSNLKPVQIAQKHGELFSFPDVGQNAFQERLISGIASSFPRKASTGTASNT